MHRQRGQAREKENPPTSVTVITIILILAMMFIVAMNQRKANEFGARLAPVIQEISRRA